MIGAALAQLIGTTALCAQVSAPDKHLDWRIDAARSEAKFQLRALAVIGVDGRIDRVEGEVWRDRKSAWVQLRVPLAALQMSSERRRRWALSAEFFDAEQHPELVFTAALPKDVRIDQLQGSLRGTLNLRGIEAPVSIVLAKPKCNRQQTVCELSAHAEVSRRLFGMTTRRLTLSDIVELDLRVRLKKSKAP